MVEYFISTTLATINLLVISPEHLKMINLELKHFQIVTEILKTFPHPVYVFGSRARGDCKRFSDLDLCVFGNPDKKEVRNLKEAFEESRLPFTVDVVVWDELSKDFQDLIKQDLVIIKD